MNDRKVAFIICTNNELYCQECIWYIEQLHIPDGYETDIICITEAKSMAEAYNAAMESSDAKYKVYLHQDVFIYHKDFIDDILKLFRSDIELGMLGVIGGIDLPGNAKVYSAWNLGCTFLCLNSEETGISGTRYQCLSKKRDYAEAEAVDGMLLATQYDIRWREDLNLGWDFYDISQSLEFRRAGYRLGIPFQKVPWCMHDCGYVYISDDRIRERILNEYTDFFPRNYAPLGERERISLPEGEIADVQEQIFKIMESCFSTGSFEQILQIRTTVKEARIVNDNLQYAMNLADIYAEEKRDVNRVGSFFFGLQSFEDMRTKYNKIKFIVRHIENDTNPEQANRLYRQIKEGHLSMESVLSISRHCAVNKNKVYQILQSL